MGIREEYPGFFIEYQSFDLVMNAIENLVTKALSKFDTKAL
jgi:hypothetical protein